LRLAIHYFSLAKKLLTAENASRAYDKQIAQLDAITSKLEEKAQIHGEPEVAVQTPTTGEPAAKEWDNFTTPEDAWKKKQIYD